MSRFTIEVNFLTGNGEKEISCIRRDTKVRNELLDERWGTPVSDIFAITANEDDYTISTRKHGWYTIHRAYDISVDGVKMTFEEFVNHMDKMI